MNGEARDEARQSCITATHENEKRAKIIQKMQNIQKIQEVQNYYISTQHVLKTYKSIRKTQKKNIKKKQVCNTNATRCKRV